MIQVFSLGGYEVSDAAAPIFLSEIGGFFGQDFDLAREMIRQVIEAGRQVPQQPMILKTEILHDAEICLPGDLMETYASKDGRVKRENYRALIERKVFPLAHYARLFDYCREADMPFIVSVYDFTGADFAAECGAAALKIASSNVVHIPLIRHCASKGLPMLIDTGRAGIGEVNAAISAARSAGCRDIVLQHSPDGHPALPKAHNLRILQTYRQAFGLPVSLSDHHVGIEMLYLSLALGASVLEKGVHVKPDELEIDISHSMDMKDLPRVLRTVHDCWLALGAPARDPNMIIEGVLGSSQRQCLVAKRDLAPGDGITLETVRFAFPCLGIPVQHFDLVEDWEITVPVAAGKPIGWSHAKPRFD